MKDDSVIPLWQRIICGILALLGMVSFFVNPLPWLSSDTSGIFEFLKFAAAIIGFLLFVYFALTGKMPFKSKNKNEN